MARNIINIEGVSKAFDIRPLLVDVSLGVSEGERIGIVGRNGGGKSTLLKVLAGVEPPDQGRVTRANWARLGMLAQVDTAEAGATVRDVVVGSKKTHEWASDSGVREIFAGLFGGYNSELLDRPFGSLSGGEKRRVGIAKLLIEPLDIILLDEPTNHLDVEGVAWLSEHIRKRRELAVVVITHDRWFLDEVSDTMWEVVDGKVEAYDGGYSAFVLSKAERSRQQAAEDARKNNLIRKELAWLRRGAPARTSKPKFRVDAANQLIASEPAPRNKAELLNFAANRLGNSVYEIHHARLAIGETTLIDSLNWNIGPGDRIGIVGVNGSGKTTLMRTLAGQYRFAAGKIQTGVTVKAAFLSQHLQELDPSWRVLEAVEKVALHVELGGGREISASQLCERLGFDYEGQQRMVRDLSGGEKRRLQLTRLLMDSPNVLLLDEPTNDFDVETLTALEDLLDTYAGVLIVISHDRYFLERVCDRFVGLLGDQALRDLPRGVDQYLELRSTMIEQSMRTAPKKTISDAAQVRLIKKEIAKLEKQIEKVQSEEKNLLSEQEAASFDHQKLIEIAEKLETIQSLRQKFEDEWLELSGKINE
ncbi:MAG: ABC-F family ATP-binding cassette domain-containing protein [Candidatus Nanopelagicaceae bacterium]|nr:ABC-F family ATP-binding cassette domain-containing protein [Candidatus Nanopelagicaceae bacterium]